MMLLALYFGQKRDTYLTPNQKENRYGSAAVVQSEAESDPY